MRRPKFASVVARRVPIEALTKDEARDTFAALDLWAPRASARIETIAADIAAAAALIRRLLLSCTPDAVNIAIAQRTAATLVTFDTRTGGERRRTWHSHGVD